MPDAERLSLVKNLVSWLREDSNNVGYTLHQEAQRLAAQGSFQDAARCCHTTMMLAQQVNDPYVRGASQFHLGLIYFLLRDGEWDRAAKLCEDATRDFHTTGNAKAEGVAFFAASKIWEDACNHAKDRWQLALRSALQALLLVQGDPDLSEVTQDFYNRFTRRYAEDLELRSKTGAPGATASAPGAAASTPRATAASPGATTSAPGAATAAPGATTTAPGATTNDTDARAQESVSTSATTAEEPSTSLPPAQEPVTPPPGAATGTVSEPPSAGPTETPPRRPNASDRKVKSPPFVAAPRTRTPLPTISGTWRLVLVAATATLGTLILVLAGVGFFTILPGLPLLAFGFVLGLGAALAALFIPFFLLEGFEQLRFRGRQNCAAVVMDPSDGRVWTFDDEAVHWLIPFREQLAAWFSLESRTLPAIHVQVIYNSEDSAYAEVNAKYHIQNAAVLWTELADFLSTRKVWGIPLPFEVNETAPPADRYAESLARDRLSYAFVLPDASQARSGAIVSQKLAELLNQETDRTGLYFYRVVVQLYKRSKLE